MNFDKPIAIVSRTSDTGGADIASYRLFTALDSMIPNVTYLSSQKICKDPKYIQIGLKHNSFMSRARNQISRFLFQLQNDDNPNFHSLGLFPTFLHRKINALHFNIVHIHWIGSNFMSILDLAKINTNIVWTFHDLWPVLGTAHHEPLNNFAQNLIDESNYNILDKFVLDKKKKYLFEKKVSIIAPSKWILNKVQNYERFKYSTIDVIPNAINSNIFKPRNDSTFRQKLGIPSSKFLILTGSYNHRSNNSLLKGSKFIKTIQTYFHKLDKDIIFIELGDSSIKKPIFQNNVVKVPLIKNSLNLAQLYSAVDVFFLSSLIENLSQMACEAQSSGVPVIAFDVGGNKETFMNYKSGFLIKPFVISDVIKSIFELKNNPIKLHSMRTISREFALKSWNSQLIAHKHIELYSRIIN